MTINSLNHAFTKKLGRFLATLSAGLLISMSLAPKASATITVFDSLGAATPTTKFLASTTGGTSILETQFVGPQFTITQPTTLTEIGGFVNKICDFPPCSSTPLTVQILPSIAGFPDPSRVLGSFSLTDDNDPDLVSYEFVAVNLPLRLEPGTYFALFAPHNDDEGSLISNAFLPFFYQAPSVNLGIVRPLDGTVFAAQFFAAVRILGETNVLIDGCDSGVGDVVLPDGSTISELVADCAEGATNHGQFVSCISRVTSDLKKNGSITTQQKNALHKCAVKA